MSPFLTPFGMSIVSLKYIQFVMLPLAFSKYTGYPVPASGASAPNTRSTNATIAGTRRTGCAFRNSICDFADDVYGDVAINPSRRRNGRRVYRARLAPARVELPSRRTHPVIPRGAPICCAFKGVEIENQICHTLSRFADCVFSGFRPVRAAYRKTRIRY